MARQITEADIGEERGGGAIQGASSGNRNGIGLNQMRTIPIITLKACFDGVFASFCSA
jgi:hypothetical protein